jgi:hypothetical protein
VFRLLSTGALVFSDLRGHLLLNQLLIGSRDRRRPPFELVDLVAVPLPGNH